MSPTQIAVICHQANMAYCRMIGDLSQKDWDRAEQWQRDSAITGVEFRLANLDAPASAQHEAWLENKQDGGWTYGEVKDPVRKTHPCLVPYDQLPDEQKVKDKLFIAIVDALK